MRKSRPAHHEGVFNAEELKRIQSAAANPIYRTGMVMDFSTSPTANVRVSTVYGVIFPMGNRDTGFKHIQERHNYYDGRQTWSVVSDEDGGEKVRLNDPPSRFGPKHLFIEVLPSIVDSILSNPLPSKPKNSAPTERDVHDGYWTDVGGERWECRLILYKGTLVAHTLFPLRSPHRAKRSLDFVRGDAIGELDEAHDWYSIKVPYRDHLGRITYQLVVKRSFTASQSETHIEAFNHDRRTAKAFVFNSVNYPPFEFGREKMELRWWSLMDLKDVEARIRELEKHGVRETQVG